jgi:hypothetical protein
MSTEEVQLKALKKQVEKITEAQIEIKTSQDNYIVNQGELLRKINEIHICLKGTEYDNGGLVKEVHENTKDIETMKRRDARTAGIALGVSAVFGTAVSFLMNILQK